MKTINLESPSNEIRNLLQEASHDDVLVRLDDGSEFMLTAVDDFDRELALTRRNEKLMALLDERTKQTETVPFAEVKRQLALK